MTELRVAVALLLLSANATAQDIEELAAYISSLPGDLKIIPLHRFVR